MAVPARRVHLPLVTSRLELRAFAPDHAPAIHAVYGDPVAMRHVGHGPVTAPQVTERMLEEYIAHQAAHGFSFWAVIERASGRLIGDAGLFTSGDRPGEVELGYTLGAAWWGRGYGMEAARACLEAGFAQLGLEEIVALADPGNLASRRVLEKLGMLPAGSRTAYGREHGLFRARRDPRAAPAPG